MFARLSRIIAVAALALSTIGVARASAQFEKGPFYVGPHIWIGGLNGATAIGAQIERGLTEPGAYGPGIISGGLGVDYYSYDFGLAATGYKYKYIPFQLFSNYHWIVESNKKIDPYVGLALVYNYVSVTYNSSTIRTGANGSGINFAGHAGLRYFISDNFAVHGQLGFGFGNLGLGVDWKF